MSGRTLLAASLEVRVCGCGHIHIDLELESGDRVTAILASDQAIVLRDELEAAAQAVARVEKDGATLQ